MIYTAQLEALDRKYGRTITIEDRAALCEKPPGALTDDDLVIIENFDGPASAAQARARRAQAVTPPVAETAPAVTRAPAFDVEAFADAVIDTIARTLDGPRVGGRFTALEQRLAALEQKPFVKFAGTWHADTCYDPGSAVVHHGGLWICTAATRGEPSKDFVSWQLAVKRGAANTTGGTR